MLLTRVFQKGSDLGIFPISGTLSAYATSEGRSVFETRTPQRTRENTVALASFNGLELSRINHTEVQWGTVAHGLLGLSR